MALKDKAKDYRKNLYFDLICGVVCSIISLTNIIGTTIMYGIINMPGWLISLTLWILWLIFSIFLISLGLYLKWKDKHFDDQAPRKDLRPPIV